MAQWMNLQRIKKFVYPMRLYMTCEKSGDLYLAEPDLTVGSPADEIWARLKILKFAVDQNIRFSAFCLAMVLHCFSNFNALQTLSSSRHYYIVVL